MQSTELPRLPGHGVSGVLFDHDNGVENSWEEKLDSSEGKEKWQEIVDAWRASGLSKAEFCKKQKVIIHQFHYWRRKLENDGSRNSSKRKSKADPRRKPMTKGKPMAESKTTDDSKPAFVEITLPKADSPSHVAGQVFRITTSYGAVMEIPI